jgi:hypothetical protein
MIPEIYAHLYASQTLIKNNTKKTYVSYFNVGSAFAF